MMVRYFEDLENGDQEYCGHHRTSESTIKEWVDKLELKIQQPDPDDGECLVPRQYIKACCGHLILTPPQEIAVKAVNEIADLEWHEPLYPGDDLSVMVKVRNVPTNEDKSPIPTIDIEVIGRNQNDEKIITYTAEAMVETKN